MSGLLIAGVILIVMGVGGVLLGRDQRVTGELAASTGRPQPRSYWMVASLIILGTGVLLFSAFVVVALLAHPAIGA